MNKMNINDLLPRLKKVKKSGNGYSAQCPAHDDKKNSLSVSETSEGKPLLKCFAGCSYSQILAALGISTNENEKQSSEKIVATYNYTDENGKLLYQNIRFAPKNFRHGHFDQNGNRV